ncbi:unnamed protein product [Lathyrus sativus]|nr:unnamed protein product [Lathyrus sativus]
MSEKSVHLPRELIEEILLRLPVKTLLLCRCVCESWLSLISGPDFATSHFQLAASTPANKLIFVESYPAPETLSIDFDASLTDDSSYSLLSLDFFGLRSRRDIVGSCRGFLFLQCDSRFYLWNPSTGVHKHIPSSNITMAHTYRFVCLLCGFGYDPSTDDYLLVFVSHKYNYDPYDPFSIDLMIFSLRANKWKQIDSGSHFPYVINDGHLPRAGLLLKEVIHWVAFNFETSRYAIIAFDLKETKMSEIALPDEFNLSVSNTSSIKYDLLVIGGLLSAWNVEKYTIEIWVMQEYKLHSSWTKTLNFSFHSAMEFSPLCFTKCGNIVGTVRGGGLAKFNDKGQLEYLSYGNRYFKRSKMTVYRESLLSLPSGSR